MRFRSAPVLLLEGRKVVRVGGDLELAGRPARAGRRARTREANAYVSTMTAANPTFIERSDVPMTASAVAATTNAAAATPCTQISRLLRRRDWYGRQNSSKRSAREPL